MRFVLLGLMILSAAPAFAEEEATLPSAVSEAPPPLHVIQNRKYSLGSELALLPGVLPADPYYKGYTASLSYTLHTSDSFGWEILQFTYSLNADTSLKERLLQIAVARGRNEPQLPEIEWTLTSRAVLKPLYGKQAFFNKRIVHLEAFVLGGPALVKRSAPIDTLEFGVDLALGLRLWLSEVWSLRFDFGNLTHLEQQNQGIKVRLAPHLSLGFAMNLRGEDG